MTLSQEQAFLADICANPHDDGVRLIYADWLTERDGPGDGERAEFIRVQCEWFWVDRAVQTTHLEIRGTTVLFTPQVDALIERYELLVEREKKLLVSVRQRLQNEWRSWADERKGPSPWWEGFQVRRGLVEHVTLKADDWCRYAERLRATQPIREVTLTTRVAIACRHRGGNRIGLFVPGEAHSFRVLLESEWLQPRYDPLASGYTYSASMALALWPGIVFHGPDFPEALS